MHTGGAVNEIQGCVMEQTLEFRRGRKSIVFATLLFAISLTVVAINPPPAQALPGDLLGTVSLPGNGGNGFSVGGTFDGTHYIATRSFMGNILDVYLPPVGGNGAATLIATKTVVDAFNAPVNISAVSWDASRGKIWGALGSNVYLIDIGDPTMTASAVATFQFNPNVMGIGLTDGIAWDVNDDTHAGRSRPPCRRGW